MGSGASSEHKRQQRAARQSTQAHQNRLQDRSRTAEQELIAVTNRITRRSLQSHQESVARDELLMELSEARTRHARQLAELEEEFQMSAEAHRAVYASGRRDGQAASSSSSPRIAGGMQSPRMGGMLHADDEEGLLLVPNPDEEMLRTRLDAERLELRRKASEQEMALQERGELELQRAAQARQELAKAQAEVETWQAEIRTELWAVRAARDESKSESHSAERFEEMKMTEVRARKREVEALREAHLGLEGQARSLHRQLSRVAYDVGQRDRELQLKDQELREVRDSISVIQEEMDEVNRQLRTQCDRVQQVEGSLQLSRDLGTKVVAMREMLQESHGALSQLSGLVERERSQREHCNSGLKQQRMRTELLMQLLHHFKSRTQDLAPHALLGQATELTNGTGWQQRMPGDAPPSPQDEQQWSAVPQAYTIPYTVSASAPMQ